MNISFSLTTPQFRARTKTVTRRLGWLKLKPGDVLQSCEKCQGLKKGEHPVKLGKIKVVHVRREPLTALLHTHAEGMLYGVTECEKEGFPHKTPEQFVSMFCLHNKCLPSSIVTRIQFYYL